MTLRVQEACLKAAREGLDQIAGRGHVSGLMSRYSLQEVQAYGIGCAGMGRDELQDRRCSSPDLP